MLLVADWPCFYFGAIELIVCLASWPRFYFRAISLIIGLIIDLAINNAVLMALKIAIDLLK